MANFDNGKIAVGAPGSKAREENNGTSANIESAVKPIDNLVKNMGLESAVKAAVKDSKTRTTTVTLEQDQTAVILNSDTMEFVSKMYTAQDDISNESKFNRTFIHTAVLAGAKQECRRIVNVWENAITKENKLHPAWSREQAERELLQSKKMQELKSLVDVALSLLKTEFK